MRPVPVCIWDLAFPEFCPDSCIESFGVRANAKEPFRWHVLPNQRLGLLSLLLAGVIRVMFEVFAVQGASSLHVEGRPDFGKIAELPVDMRPDR